MSNSDQILKGINIWIESKVDELTTNSILMSLMHETVKRTAGQIVEALIPVKMLELMFCNHGVIDADLFAGELTRALNKAPEISEEYGGVVIHLKQGMIQIELPDASVVRSILNGHNVINLRESDIRELAECINDVKNHSYV